MEDHIRHLRSLLQATPLASEATHAALIAAVTKLMLAKPARKGGPEAAEARGEAYEAALDDVPLFAVIAAIRKWYRGECGKDENGEAYAYDWAPESAALRRLALREVFQVHGRIMLLEDLLNAAPFVDCTVELEEGQAAMRGLWRAIARKQNIKELTFADAVALGNEKTLEAGSGSSLPMVDLSGLSITERSEALCETPLT